MLCLRVFDHKIVMKERDKMNTDFIVKINFIRERKRERRLISKLRLAKGMI